MGNFGSGLVQGIQAYNENKQKQEQIAAQKQYWSSLEKAQQAETSLRQLHAADTLRTWSRQAEQDQAMRKFLGDVPEGFPLPPSIDPYTPSQPVPSPDLRGNMLQQGNAAPEPSIVPASMPMPQAQPAGMPPSQPNRMGGIPATLKQNMSIAMQFGGPQAAAKVFETWAAQQGKEQHRNPVVASPGSTVLIPQPDGTFQEKLISERPEKAMIVPEGGKLVNPVTGVAIAQGNPKAEKPKDFGDANEAVAEELYSKPFAQLDQKQKAAVNARVKKDKTDVAAAGAEVRADVAMNQPLPPNQANELGVPYGTTREQAKGLPVLTPQQREGLMAYDSARSILADIAQYSERVNVASGGLTGKAKQSMKLWGAWTQSDPDAALLQAKAGELSMIARSLGEKGALANQDIARAAGLIPLVTDTQDVAIKKIHDMTAIIDRGEANYRKSLGVGARQPVQEKAATAQDIPIPKGIPAEQHDAYRKAYRDQQRKMQGGR